MDGLEDILQAALVENASDVHVVPGQTVFFRRDGVLYPFGNYVAGAQQTANFIERYLTQERQAELYRQRTLDFAFAISGERFRGNAYFACGTVCLSIRLLPRRVRSLDELGDTALIKNLTGISEGLVLVTGRTGSGKTTMLAALINEITRQRAAHIVALEDPTEYILPPQKGLISQREYGTDFMSFAEAVRDSLREMPDVVVIGEIRDADSMRAALMAAQTGVLVMGSLHTKNAVETAMRVEGMFGENVRAVVRDEFAGVLSATIAVRLVPAAVGGRTCAAEIMTATTAVRNLLRQGKYGQIPSVMLTGADGMQTFSASLKNLYDAGKISAEVYRDCKNAE